MDTETRKRISDKYREWKFGLFFHFGIRTFCPGHEDWDRKPMPKELFAPTDISVTDWIETAVRAGAKYTVLTTKHHDGFCLWPTEYSDYSVRNVPFMNGKADIVRSYVDASKTAGLGIGLYYSLAQWNAPDMAEMNSGDYDEHVIGQLTELLSNYGKIDYLWFDGCGASGHTFDIDRILDTIYSLQPEILLFGGKEWDPTVVWVGNEEGYADDIERTEPTECDCMIRDTWFYDDNADTVKTPEKLYEMYSKTVGRNCNMLLNIGPDRRGRIAEEDRKALLGMSEMVHEQLA